MIYPAFVRTLAKAVGSFWFASVILVLLMVAMGAATVHEHVHGTAAAQAAFYGATWFRLLLGLLAANLAAAVAARVPLRRAQIPFLLAHGGILLILGGTLITARFGVEGQLLLGQGQTRSTFLVPGERLTLVGAGGAEATVDLARALGNGRSTVERLAAPELTLDAVRVRALCYLPDSDWVQRIANDGDVPRLALELSLGAAGQEERLWVLAGAEAEIGGMPVTVTEVGTPAAWAQAIGEGGAGTRGTLRVTAGEHVYDVDLESCLDQPAAVGATPYTVRVKRYLPHAVVGADRTIVNASPEPVNPAVEIEIAGPEGIDTRLAFALFPDFHGRPGEQRLKDVRVVFAATAAQAPTVATQVYSGPEGRLAVRFAWPGAAPATQVLSLGQGVPAPASGQTFRVLQRLERAQESFVAVLRRPSGAVSRPALQVRVTDVAGERDVWLQKHGEQRWAAAGGAYVLSYGDELRPLGLGVTLDEFRIGYYPGGEKPRSYESHVRLTEPATGQARSLVISMNRPASGAGYTLYQSSYQRHGAGLATVLSVSRDPGRPVVFAGYGAALLGLVLLLARRLRAQRGSGGRSVSACSWIPVVLTLGSLSLGAAAPALPTTVDVASLRDVVVQHDGRCMPLDTLARDLVSSATGTRSSGVGEPLMLLLAWTFDAAAWQEAPLVQIRSEPLRAAIQLPLSRTRFSYRELVAHEHFQALLEQADNLRAGQKADALQQKVGKIRDQLVVLQQVFQGLSIKLVPEAGDVQGPWCAVGALVQSEATELQALRQAWTALGAAFNADDGAVFAAAAGRLKAELGRFGTSAWPSLERLAQELRYNRLGLYRKAWTTLAIAALLAAVALRVRRRWFDGLAAAVTLVGLGLFTYGLSLRWAVAGRIPASNMFESLLFLSWGAAAFAFAAFFLFRQRSVPLTAATIAALALCLADRLPLDPFIRPVVPVLLDTFWMSVHVPVIMISYAVLAIAVLIAHVQLVATALLPPERPLTGALDRLLYGYILAGSLLLLVGIVTGSMWAASSWGRYWGWDPKEVWSLVALLGYMAIVHVRLDTTRRSGWALAVAGALTLAVFLTVALRLAPLTLGKALALAATAAAVAYFVLARSLFATAAKSIIAFWLIIMTYVGVNYVLGTGLHSYGFGFGAVATRMCQIGAADLGLVAVFGIIHARRRRSA